MKSVMKSIRNSIQNNKEYPVGMMITAGAAVLLSTLQAFAGGSSSGGGNGVICFDHVAIAERVKANKGVVENSDLSHVTSLEMVDLYQARKRRGLQGKQPELVPIDESQAVDDAEAIRGYFKKIEKRFETVAPQVSMYMQAFGNYLNDETMRFHNNPVHQMRDADLEIELDNPACTFTTLAYNEIISDDLVYIHFDERLFNLKNTYTTHSRLSKAVLVLHEFQYLVSRMTNEGTTSSKKTRDYVGYLITQNTGVSILRFLEISHALGFTKTSEMNFEFSKQGLGIQFRPEFDAFPYRKLIDVTTSLVFSMNGKRNMATAAEEYAQALYAKAPNFINQVSEVVSRSFTVTNPTETNLGIWSLDSAVYWLEVILNRRTTPSIGRVQVVAADQELAAQLLERARGYQTERKELMKAAGKAMADEALREVDLIPYLSGENKAEITDAIYGAIEEFASASMEIEFAQTGEAYFENGLKLPSYGGKSRFAKEQDPRNGVLILKRIISGNLDFLRTALKNTQLPSVQ